MDPATALAYATEAVRCFVHKGWMFDWKLKTTVKLIHPHGPENFHHSGVVFIDVFGHKLAGPEQYIRLCVLFPQQKMPQHHHKLRQETFTVVSGTVELVCGRSRSHISPGEKMSPNVEELHGVETDLLGGAYVGVCHKDHLTDVYWEDEATLSDHRMTVIDFTRVPQLPCTIREDISQGRFYHPQWNALISELAQEKH